MVLSRGGQSSKKEMFRGVLVAPNVIWIRICEKKPGYKILECWAFFNRIIKKYRDDDLVDFDFHFSPEKIAAIGLRKTLVLEEKLFNLSKKRYIA